MTKKQFWYWGSGSAARLKAVVETVGREVVRELTKNQFWYWVWVSS